MKSASGVIPGLRNLKECNEKFIKNKEQNEKTEPVSKQVKFYIQNGKV